ncbi:MAG: tetratricopeptide repeat protein [Longimicrobiales bacterium]
MSRVNHKTDRSEWALRGLAALLSLVFLIGVAACGDDVPDAEATVSLGAVSAAQPGEADPGNDLGSTPDPTPEPAVPEPPRVVSYDEAESAYHAGTFGEAVDLFTSYTTQKPDNPWGHYMLGLSAWRAGHLDVAETALSESVGMDPNHVKGHVNLARVLLEKGELDRGLEHATLAEDIDPASGQAKRTLARAMAETGDVPGALDMYERALWLNPTDKWALNNLGYLLVQEGRFEDAMGPLALAVSVDTSSALFFNNLGSALEGAGHTVAAVQAFSGAAELDPQHTKALASLTRLQDVVSIEELPEVDVVALGVEFRERLVGAVEQVDVQRHGEPGEPAETGQNGESRGNEVR